VVVTKYHLRAVHQKRLMICIRDHQTLPNSRGQAANPANGSLYLRLTLLPSLKMIPSASVTVMTTRRQGRRRAKLMRQSGFRKRLLKLWRDQWGKTVKLHLARPRALAQTLSTAMRLPRNCVYHTHESQISDRKSAVSQMRSVCDSHCISAHVAPS
jgi:hypothetical protein